MKHKLKNRIMCLFAALWLMTSPMLSVLPVRADGETMPSGTGITETIGTSETTQTDGVNPSGTEQNGTANPTEIIGAVGAAGVIENAGVETQEEPNFCVQSIEVYPEGEDNDKLIVLEGLMPEDATAEAVDVTEERDGNVIAAYDITIKDDGGEEFQPDEENPINVEISDERISGENESLELWHVLDDGTRVQITEFTVEEGKICFEAEGFSVYEIVDGVSQSQESLLDLLASKGEDGLYVAFYCKKESNNNVGPYYYKGGEKTIPGQFERKGLYLTAKNAIDDATKLYFEKSGTDNDKYYIYEKDGENKKYIQNLHTGTYGDNAERKEKRAALKYAETESDRTEFIVDIENGRFRIGEANGFYWVAENNNYQAIVSYKNKTDANLAWMDIIGLTNDSLKLDGKEFGLMNYTGGTHGYALMADSADNYVHSLVELVTHQMKDSNGQQVEGRTLYVDEGSEVSKWKFHNVDSDNYSLSATTETGEKYLAVQNNALVLVDNADAATPFAVTTNSDKKIQLSYQGQYVSLYYNDNGQNVETRFELSSTSSANTWLNLIDFAKLSDDNLIVYSADRISVSRKDLNGKKVIVYTRIWNEQTLRYDIYAVDYNGTLFPCYASGGKILWLGDSTGSLEWEFTEYYDSVTKEPNYYYELFNPYSEKYLAPQMTGNQVLSDNPIGINMQGRRNGEFYSDIVAWDNTRYAFIGLKPNEDKTKLVPCSQSNSVTFYFATLEDLNLSGELHPVETLDNKDYGISMRMVDFEDKGELEAVTGDVKFNATTGTKGMLSTNLDDSGYPQVVYKNKNKSLGDLFGSKAIDVNHLFIKSIYNSSGYFEFDSCQNFATLCDRDGNVMTSNGGDPIDFTVYRELGTTDEAVKNTLKHGQFLPFNIIKENLYTSQNSQNLFSAAATAVNNPSAAEGQLDESNPRKYEKLYQVLNSNGQGKANYQNGLELEASFVQTVSGLDAWGHDIIFEFTGDDDFWLYVDGELVIDLGGDHSALAGSVNFRTGDVIVDGYTDSNMKKRTLRQIFESNYKKRNPGATQAQVDEYLAEYFNEGEDIFKDYSKHTMRVFYMERGGGASNLHMKFNLASVTPGNVVISKNVEGPGAALLDKDFLEYPFQIYYTLPKDETGEPGEEKLLGNDDQHIHVTYQNSNQPVTFVRKYRPPGVDESEAYENIYFINPTKKAEISFPDGTISYRIVECAVDHSVYPRVKINGEDVPAGRYEIKGNLYNYSSEEATAETKPSISFDNYVNAEVIKDLYITKKLLDENDQEITDDTATFNFRLSLSTVDVSADTIPKANMARYFVLSPNRKVCRYDSVRKKFAETDISANNRHLSSLLKELSEGPVDGINYDDVVFRSSGFGAISGIPAGYTIVVPGLPVGTVFKVTEDVKTGYGLVGYYRVMGTKIKEDYSVEDIPSYREYDSNPLNVGKVIAEENPQMEVHNKKGYGLTVNKKWSDLNLTTAHDSVYVAVYVDGELLDGSVRQIKSPSTSAYYFWPALEKNADGSERTDFTGYVVKEVELTGTSYSVSEDGTVTGYESVTPLAAGSEIKLTATRTKQATPDGESSNKQFDYVVSYQEGTFDGSTRTDTVSNTRKGGIAVRLFKWNSEVPLKGGSFTLTDETETKVGDYVSDSEGIVTMLYTFERNKLYTLTETSAPEGYVGLQKKCSFKINDDDSVSMYYEDGTTSWGTNNVDDVKWANSKPGENGIIAFIDVYNKQFNFVIKKSDRYKTDNMLESAHFALYKQVNTTIGGYMKSKDPMTGFEDFSTDGNGNVYVCGGDSGRVIMPGKNGSVYFLTEIQAPDGYSKLKDDIVFRISPIGVPSLISDSYNGSLRETEDSYIYTLSVPNEKSSAGFTVTKTVAGNMGNKAEEFIFRFDVIDSAGSTETEFAWKKNGVEQTTTLQSGDTFQLGHEDSVKIMVPEGTKVKITENVSPGEGYTTTFKLDNNTPETVTSKEFVVDDGTVLSVVNERNVLVPTGVFLPVGGLIAVTILIWAGVIATIINRRKYEEEL